MEWWPHRLTLRRFASFKRNSSRQAVGADPAIRGFVGGTLDTATKGSVHQVLGSFFFGRENVIPGRFRSLPAHW